MATVVGVITALIFVVSLFAFPNFGKTVGGLTLVGVVALYVAHETDQKAQKSVEAAAGVEIHYLQTTNAKLYEQFGSWNLRLDVKNDHALRSLQRLKGIVQLTECEENTRSCIVIGQSEFNDWPDIPPGQLRQLNMLVSFPNLPTDSTRKREFHFSVKAAYFK